MKSLSRITKRSKDQKVAKTTEENNGSLKSLEQANSKEANINNMVGQNDVVNTRKSRGNNNNITPNKKKKETYQSQPNTKRRQVAKKNDQPTPTRKRNSTRKKMDEKETRKVFITGDSQLRKINGETLSRDRHSVAVKPMPGAKIARIKNVKIEEDANVVIVHAGTCNIQQQTNPENLAEEITSTLRSVKVNLPKAQVAFSSILKRNDDLELNAKVLKTNKLLEEKLLLCGIDFISNDNIRYGNISFDGLHINEGGGCKNASLQLQ